MMISDNIEQDHLDAQFCLGQMSYYYQWILHNFDPLIGRRVWDAGAGVGHVSTLLEEKVDMLLSTEFAPENLKMLEQRFCGNMQVDVR